MKKSFPTYMIEYSETFIRRPLMVLDQSGLLSQVPPYKGLEKTLNDEKLRFSDLYDE